MTETPPIVGFITARYVEDEAVARTATKGPWTDGGGNPANGDGDGFGEVWILPPDDNEYEPDEATAAHIARWDPVAVLADVAAKREILGECAVFLEAFEHGDAALRNPGYKLAWNTARRLARPFAEHADYDRAWWIEDWRPSTAPAQ